jgi:hypothetical protein
MSRHTPAGSMDSAQRPAGREIAVRRRTRACKEQRPPARAECAARERPSQRCSSGLLRGAAQHAGVTAHARSRSADSEEPEALVRDHAPRPADPSEPNVLHRSRLSPSHPDTCLRAAHAHVEALQLAVALHPQSPRNTGPARAPQLHRNALRGVPARDMRVPLLQGAQVCDCSHGRCPLVFRLRLMKVDRVSVLV